MDVQDSLLVVSDNDIFDNAGRFQHLSCWLVRHVRVVPNLIDDLIELNDPELADSAIVLVRSIAAKWQDFTDDAVNQRNREVDRRLATEQKALLSAREGDQAVAA